MVRMTVAIILKKKMAGNHRHHVTALATIGIDQKLVLVIVAAAVTVKVIGEDVTVDVAMNVSVSRDVIERKVHPANSRPKTAMSPSAAAAQARARVGRKKRRRAPRTGRKRTNNSRKFSSNLP